MPDILIRGVGFPKDNPASFTLYPDGTVSWREYHEFAKHGNITNGALIVQFPRAIELPPHGDLIDANALKEKSEYDRKHLEITGYERELLWHYLDVSMAPVIVPASKEGTNDPQT